MEKAGRQRAAEVTVKTISWYSDTSSERFPVMETAVDHTALPWWALVLIEGSLQRELVGRARATSTYLDAGLGLIGETHAQNDKG